MPILLYSLEICPFTKTDYRSLDFVVMRFLMKLFYTSNSDIVNECRMYFGFELPSEIFPTRIDKFMSKLSDVVETCYSVLYVISCFRLVKCCLFVVFAFFSFATNLWWIKIIIIKITNICFHRKTTVGLYCLQLQFALLLTNLRPAFSDFRTT